MRKIAEGTHVCGDPGMQFDTTINDWHTCKNTDRIHASNPCSEYMFLDDSACNLASLNLMKFRSEDGEFDIDAFRHAVRVMILAMEIIVGNSSYPRPRDRGQQPPLPAPGPGLRQPGRPADVPRPALRQRRGPRLRRGDHRPDVRPGLPDLGRDRQPHRAVRGLRREPRAHARGHPQAPRRHQRHQRQPGARAPARRGRRRSGARPMPWATTTATATPRSRSWRRPAPSAS